MQTISTKASEGVVSMQAQHAPEPWVIDRDDDAEILEIVSAERGGYVPVAKVPFGYSEPFESEQHANARLIAAAPDMLNALKAIADFYGWKFGEPVGATARQVVNAIAKAEGR